MIAKGNCQHCNQPIEFEAESSGQFFPCPACGQQTRLLLPGKAFTNTAASIAAKAKNQMEPRIIPCLDCGNEVSRRALFCPHCGEYESGLYRKLWKISVGAVLMLVLFGFLMELLWHLLQLLP